MKSLTESKSADEAFTKHNQDIFERTFLMLCHYWLVRVGYEKNKKGYWSIKVENQRGGGAGK